jgi:hypothetical protein
MVSGTIGATDVAVSVIYSPNTGTTFKVRHYKISRTGVSTLANTDTLKGTTGSTVFATARTYSGYTYISNHENAVRSGTVKGDGSLVLKLYYQRNAATTPPVVPQPPATPQTIVVTQPVVAPAEPVVQEPVENIVPPETPTTNIDETETPTTIIDTGAWSLVNLILVALGLLIAICLCLFTVARRDLRRFEASSSFDPRAILRGAAIVFGVVPVILFFILEDITKVMSIVDGYTPIFVATFVVTVLLAVAALLLDRKNAQDGTDGDLSAA